jgi:hypothetical protein
VLIHSKENTPDEILEFARAWRRQVPLVLVPTAYPQLSFAKIAGLGKVGLIICANHAIRAAVVIPRPTDGWPVVQADQASPSMVPPTGIKQKASSSDISTMPSRPTLMCRPEKVWTAPVPGGAWTRTFTGGQEGVAPNGIELHPILMIDLQH